MAAWEQDEVVSQTPAWQQDEIVEQPAPTRSMGQELGRQAGLTARTAANVLTSPLQVGGNVLNKAINAMSGKPVVTPFGNFTMPNIPTLEMPSDIISRQLDRFTPTPQTGTERFTQEVAKSAPAFAIPATLPLQVAGNAGINAAMAPQGDEASAAAWGAGGGAVGQGLARTVSGLVRPTAEAQTLIDKEVALTPGQAAGTGSWLGRTEQSWSSNPIAAPFIRPAQRRGVEEANVAAAQSVASLVDDSIKLGKPPREAIEQTRDVISNAYHKSLEGMSVNPAALKNDLVASIQHLPTDFPLMPPATLKSINAYINNRLGPLLEGGQPLTGDMMKQIDSELGQMARNFASSPNATDKVQAPAWREVQSHVRFAMENATTPDKAKLLMDANNAYRQLLAIEKSLPAGAETFTPRQLKRTLEKAGIKGTELNSISQAMDKTLPNAVNDSGTTERLLTNLLPTALLGGGYGAHQLGFDTAGTGMVAAGALGSRPGSRFMTGGYGWQRSKLLSDALRKSTATVIRTRGTDTPSGGE